MQMDKLACSVHLSLATIIGQLWNRQSDAVDQCVFVCSFNYTGKRGIRSTVFLLKRIAVASKCLLRMPLGMLIGDN